MLESPLHVGFVYVLTNDADSEFVKIGFTKLLSEDRAQDLYGTGVRQPFKVAFRILSTQYELIERKTHKMLDEFRPNKRREFFKVSVQQAIAAVRLAALEVAGLSSWKATDTYRLRAGDRLALTLEAGQWFALLSYKNFLSPAADLIDVWQAHADGDSLEIFCTDLPHYVSSLSEMDPQGSVDPLPHLDRNATVPNGVINGKERLMPGERLVWLSPPGSRAPFTSVVFEALSHCQVVSRTWSIRIDPSGFPLLLNAFDHLGPPSPEATKAINDARHLPIPRRWAPRDDRDENWAQIGTDPVPPEMALEQLAPKKRSGTRRPRRSGHK